MNQSELCFHYIFHSKESEADDVTAVHVRGRGCHRGGRGRRDRGGRDHSRQPPPVQQDAGTWWEVDDCSSTASTSRFNPFKTPGVQCNLQADSKPIDALKFVLTDDVLHTLLINEYAMEKVNLNRPARRRSVYENWTNMTLAVLYKFPAVLIAMGINRKPSIRIYWSTSEETYTPWYRQIFSRERFESIYHTMLHASDCGSTGNAKIQPFVNDLITNMQAAFYPYRIAAIDEMVIGYNGTFHAKQFSSSEP